MDKDIIFRKKFSNSDFQSNSQSLKLNPKVTVLMAVYNGEKYLRESIESILNQTFTDFEFLIINDGSKDKSVEIINSYNDPRIKFYSNDKNLKLADTLNKGLELSNGKYIARMDCDDISFPERLEKQVNFMDIHPDIGICGTWIETIGDVEGDIWDYPIDDEIIRCRFFFGSTLVHPSVIIRRNLFENTGLKYNVNCKYAQDYDLWLRFLDYTKFSNIGEVLLYYRTYNEIKKKSIEMEQEKVADGLLLKQLLNLKIKPIEEEFILHKSLCSWKFKLDKNYVNKVEQWLSNLKDKNEKLSYYPEPAFSEVLAERWVAVCNSNISLGFWLWKKFCSSPLSNYVNCIEKVKVLFRCIRK